MDNKSFLAVVGSIFSVIAVLHGLRLLNGWEAVIGGWMVPMWFSWVAIIVAGFLAWSSFRAKK